MEREIKVYAIKEGCELGNNFNCKVLAFSFGLFAETERNLISQRPKEALAR
jgi:DNA invertase Pin-like site-specific DNA recombinase